MHWTTLHWQGDALTGQFQILDQTLLPEQERMIDLTNVDDVWVAIKALKVRGAPAIGCAAAYGAVVGAVVKESTYADGANIRSDGA